MTFGEFKTRVAGVGVQDTDKMWVIDVMGFRADSPTEARKEHMIVFETATDLQFFPVEE